MHTDQHCRRNEMSYSERIELKMTRIEAINSPNSFKGAAEQSARLEVFVNDRDDTIVESKAKIAELFDAKEALIISEGLRKAAAEQSARLEVVVKERDDTIIELETKIAELLGANENVTNNAASSKGALEQNESVDDLSLLLSRSLGKGQSVDVDKSTDEVLEVEAIVDFRLSDNGAREFLIRWMGFSPNADTWEPESNLFCEDLLSTFLRDNELELKDVGEDTVSDSYDCDNDGDNDGDNDVNDDDDDEDYSGGQVVKASTNYTRKSARTSKPTQLLNYRHKPECCVCKKTLLDIPGVRGPLSCSVKCTKLAEKKRTNH